MSCGCICTVEYFSPSTNIIVYCPLHAAAGEMLEVVRLAMQDAGTSLTVYMKAKAILSKLTNQEEKR